MLEVARGVQGSLQQPRSVVAASLLPQDDEDTEPEAILDRAQVWYEKSQTPLMHACKKGDLARAKKLVAGGAQIDARDNLGLTPMIYACKFNMEEDSLSLAKLLFEHSAGLSSESLGINDALAHASSKDRIELTAFLSFIHSIPLEHFHSNALRVIVVKVFDQGVRTLEEARRLTPARLEQLGVSSAPDRRDFLRAFVDSEQIASLEVLAAKVTLARTKRKEGKPILHPRLAKVFAEQVLRKDPVAYFADFDMQQVFLREREKDLMALQEAVKTDSTQKSKRDKTRRELVEGIRKALSGGVEGQLENTLADPGSKAVIDTCQSLWKEVLKEFLDADNAHAPVTFEDVQEATQAAIEAIKYWETRHDPTAACKRTEAAIDALNESIKRLGIEPTFLMTFRHPEKTRDLVMELHNVQQSLNAELSILTGVDPMADAPLEEVRRALASTISFYNCTVKNEVSRLQKAAKHLSSSLSKHVPGLAPPDTSRMKEMIKIASQNKRKREDFELNLERAREDVNNGDARARDRIPGLERELSQLGSVYKLDSELRKERARVLRHAEEHYPELLRDDKWMKSLGVNASVPRELFTLGLWLTNAKRGDFQILAELASKPGKSVLKVRDLKGRAFVLKSFHLANDQWSSRFYRQVAALAQIKSAYIVRIQRVFMQDAHQGCILMPFYAGGDLAAWIRDNPHADVPTRTRIAIGLLSGLHDLHSQGFVHCDVKPENVFLAPGLSPVLGDFDGVQMHNVTMTQPMQATYRYMAPELRNNHVGKVESAVDLFSVGVVLADLFKNTKVSDATTSLISSLQSTVPTQRPTALQALRHEAFQVEPVNQASCAICLDIYPISEGVSCADGHFTCKECLSESVRAATQPDAHVEVRRDGSMCCVIPDCELLISGRAIASAVPDEDFTALLDIVRKHFERDAAAEQERQLLLRLAAALREHELHPATQDHIRTIQNEILTMSCPRCSAAFVDFDGCCALECSACPCRFCAWCLQDAGNDSQACHQHVASCASKPAGEDRFFGQKHVVRQVWCRLRAQRLHDYMAKRVQDAGIRASVQNKLRPLLTPDIVGDNFSF